MENSKLNTAPNNSRSASEPNVPVTPNYLPPYLVTYPKFDT